MGPFAKSELGKAETALCLGAPTLIEEQKVKVIFNTFYF